MYKKKFKKGGQILNIVGLLIHINRGKWLYYNDKLMHPGFIIGMPLKTIIHAIDNKIIYTAKENK